jgi:hypothetical protein
MNKEVDPDRLISQIGEYTRNGTEFFDLVTRIVIYEKYNTRCYAAVGSLVYHHAIDYIKDFYNSKSGDACLYCECRKVNQRIFELISEAIHIEGVRV